jgi:hypothetical protein
MKSPDPKALQELILKCWMTHDAMWFYHCLQEFGIERANQLNKSAIKSLAAIEIERVRKAFGIEEVKDFDDLKAVVEAGFTALKGDFMGFDYTFPAENVVHWDMKKCFAHTGMTRLGVIDRYECGVVYRVKCWFGSLGIKYDVTPSVERCIMHTSGSCRGDFRFYL